MQKNSSRLRKTINNKLNSHLIILGIPMGALDADPLESKFDYIVDYVNFAANLTLGIGIGLAVVFLILGGIAWATSQGDPKAVQKAQAKLTWTIIGFVIVIGSIAIKALISNLLGANVPWWPSTPF